MIRILMIIFFFIASLSSTFAQNNFTMNWKTLPERPIAVGGQFAGVSHRALIAAGGAYFPTPLFEGSEKVWIDSIFVLKDESNTWQSTENLPRPLAYGASISDEKGLIIIGGGDSEQHYKDVFRLVWNNNRIAIENFPPLPQPCAFQTAIKINSSIYVVGGQTKPSSKQALHTCWKLDLKQIENGWQSIESYPGPARILPVAGSYKGKFYLFSGCELYVDSNEETKRRYLKDAYSYSERSGWKTLPNLLRSVTAAPSPAFTHNNTIMIFSGDTGKNADKVWELKDKHPGFSRTIVSLNVDTMKWKEYGQLPFSLATTPTIIWNNGYVIPGGEDRPGHRTPIVYQGKISSK